MSFSKIMALITLLTNESDVRQAVAAVVGGDHDLAYARTWDRLIRLVRERPVTTVVLDGAGGPAEPVAGVADLRRRFPSLGCVFVHRPQVDPLTLFRLGRAGIESLAVVQMDGLTEGLRRAISSAAAQGTEAQVVRRLGSRLPGREIAFVRHALNGVQQGWSTDRLAQRIGLTRAHLSVRLRARGLPSAGHLLLWAKLLHAGRWLSDPGRSAQSISRQLEYSSGAAFRRALHHYVGRTPTSIRAGGGLRVVLAAFLDACGLGDTVRDDRSVA